jgi:hypothetical protein
MAASSWSAVAECGASDPDQFDADAQTGAWPQRLHYLLIFLTLIPALFCLDHTSRDFVKRDTPASKPMS